MKNNQNATPVELPKPLSPKELITIKGGQGTANETIRVQDIVMQ